MITAIHHAAADLAVMLSLGAPVAWAGSGTIAFHGAVVVPTCAIQGAGATGLPSATPRAVHPCPSQAGAGAAGYFTQTRVPIPGHTGDLLLDYFAQTHAPAGGQAGNDLIVRVYL